MGRGSGVGGQGKNVPHKILKSPTPTRNSTFQLKHPNTQTLKPRMRMSKFGIFGKVAAPLCFPLKCDKICMFFDRGTVPLNGKRDERHEKFGH